MLLEVHKLKTYYFTLKGTVRAVDNVNFNINENDEANDLCYKNLKDNLQAFHKSNENIKFATKNNIDNVKKDKNHPMLIFNLQDQIEKELAKIYSFYEVLNWIENSEEEILFNTVHAEEMIIDFFWWEEMWNYTILM